MLGKIRKCFSQSLMLEKPDRELRSIFILRTQVNNNWVLVLESVALKL